MKLRLFPHRDPRALQLLGHGVILGQADEAVLRVEVAPRIPHVAEVQMRRDHVGQRHRGTDGAVRALARLADAPVAVLQRLAQHRADALDRVGEPALATAR